MPKKRVWRNFGSQATQPNGTHWAVRLTGLSDIVETFATALLVNDDCRDQNSVSVLVPCALATRRIDQCWRPQLYMLFRSTRKCGPPLVRDASALRLPESTVTLERVENTDPSHWLTQTPLADRRNMLDAVHAAAVAAGDLLSEPVQVTFFDDAVRSRLLFLRTALRLKRARAFENRLQAQSSGSARSDSSSSDSSSDSEPATPAPPPSPVTPSVVPFVKPRSTRLDDLIMSFRTHTYHPLLQRVVPLHPLHQPTRLTHYMPFLFCT